MKQSTLALCTALAACFLVGCPPRYQVYEGPLTPSTDEPVWVARGSGEFGVGNAMVLCGVGLATGEPSVEARREKALSGARAALAGQFDLYISDLTLSLGEALTLVGRPKSMSWTEFLSGVAGAIRDERLAGASEVALWHCEITDEQFALVELGLKGFMDAFRAEAQRQAEENKEDLFGDRTRQALTFLSAELHGVAWRQARGPLDGPPAGTGPQ